MPASESFRFRPDLNHAAVLSLQLDLNVALCKRQALHAHVPGEDDDREFCRRLLEEQHVVAVPGSVFGPGGEGSIRISFGAASAERLTEVATRIARGAS